MVILLGTSTNKIFNKRHKSTENSISNCSADNNWDNLGAATKQKRIFSSSTTPLTWQKIRKFMAKKILRKFRFSSIHDAFNIGDHLKFKQCQAFFAQFRS